MVNIDICKITSVMAPKYSVIIIPGEGGGGGGGRQLCHFLPGCVHIN